MTHFSLRVIAVVLGILMILWGSARAEWQTFGRTTGGWHTNIEPSWGCMTLSQEGFAIFATSDGAWVGAVNAIRQMRMQVGRVVSMGIDDDWSSAGEMFTVSDSGFTVAAPVTEKFFMTLAGGSYFTFFDGERRLRYSLVGSAEAIDQLADCLLAR